MLSLSAIGMISLELTRHFCIYELFLRQETTSRYFYVLICAFNISEMLRAKTSISSSLPTLPPSPPRLIQSKEIWSQQGYFLMETDSLKCGKIPRGSENSDGYEANHLKIPEAGIFQNSMLLGQGVRKRFQTPESSSLHSGRSLTLCYFTAKEQMVQAKDSKCGINLRKCSCLWSQSYIQTRCPRFLLE